MALVDTSRDAYNEVVKPTLAKRQQDVYDAIVLSPNHTAAEYARDLVKPVNTISGRFGELRKLNKIARVERRQCNVTKGMAYTWRDVQ